MPFALSRFHTIVLATLLVVAPAWAQQVAPDDVAAAHQLLQRQRRAELPAETLIRQHRYPEAQRLVDAALRKSPRDRKQQELRAKLLIQAWKLDEAMQVARSIGSDVLVGRIQLLRTDFDDALATARKAIAANPMNAEAHMLEADVHFWKEKPELAEAPLRRALELDPLNADARFSYGYAIWRRVDARQLPAMAAQWNLALAIDSLHYITHWHFGNGHTHLTYADYAQPSDEEVRKQLRDVDSLIAQQKIAEALARVRTIERQFPDALLPTLTRGSIFYLATSLDRAARLDSAQTAFLGLLRRKPNYGPAHNALAAVIKQRQFTYHAKFDSLEAEIAKQVVPADSAFYREFRNIRYYPGDRVVKMAVQQLGPAMAYIPFIARMGYSYVIPPLHHDLTHAMNQPFFRTSTTFDNRQWMDIRGSGGNNASAGIEYVERGSHQERVVLLHEYVHQFHGAVLTDQQNRRIRKLYHDAMANDRALDYYAANNESEFFAQAYEAYLTPVKVHPLNHKAMNTTADLVRKDPELYAFLDTLITENRRFLSGDSSAMRQNWAQVFVTLARQARLSARGNAEQLARAGVYLDSAALFSRTYVPALLERVSLHQAAGRFADAETVLHEAARLAPNYAPVFEARAQLMEARNRSEGRPRDVAAEIVLYKRALELEDDLSERADLNRTLRELYRDQAMYGEALAIADDHVKNAPTPSTYLRDRRDEAAAFAAQLRSTMGEDQRSFFAELVKRKPQHMPHRIQAVWAAYQRGDTQMATQLVKDVGALLRATGNAPPSYRTAHAVLVGNTTEDSTFIRTTVGNRGDGLGHDDRIRLAVHLADRGRVEEALQLVPADSANWSPHEHADFRYVQGVVALKRAETAEGKRLLGEVLKINPGHWGARARLR